MPKGDYKKSIEGRVPLQGIVRDGVLAAILDHEGNELGAPLTTRINEVTGGIEISTSGGASFSTEITRRVRSLLGPVVIDFAAMSGLPAGASFSGSGSYAGAGILAVQSTGTVTHSPTGWHDGTACLEFVPNTDAGAEVRFYIAAGLNIYDPDGIAFEYELPTDLDTSKANFSVSFQFSNDATDLYATNLKSMRMWTCDQATATTKEKGGRKYIRQRWDHDATNANAGAFAGYGQSTLGTGADEKLNIKYFRVLASKFSGKTIKLKCVRKGGVSTPCFVLGSDNAGPEDLALRAFGYMAQKGLPGYVNQYLSGIALPGALDRIRRIYASGVEVNANDTVDRPLGSTVTDEATMRSAIETTKTTLLNYGFHRGHRVWIANNNSSSYLMIRELERAGYVMNRNGETESGYYCFPEGGLPDAMRTPAKSLDNMNWTAIKEIVDRTITYGCTFWAYWHGVLSSTQIDVDRTANITGVAGAPVAREGTETLQQYRARALALGTAVGTASVAYFDARIGTSALGVWWEELKQLFDYLAPKNMDGTCAVMSPEAWGRDVGLM